MHTTLRQHPTSYSTLSSVLTIAGSDSSGGAGIEADLKTFSAHKCYGVTCITALTAQNSSGISAVMETPESHLRQTLAAVMDEFSAGRLSLKVVKTGMLTKPAIAVVASYIEQFRQSGIRMVVDPVMVSTSGVTLADDPTMKLCMETVVPNAYLCTPNLDEAMKMGGRKQSIRDVQEFSDFAVELHGRLGCENLLLKGGHIPFGSSGATGETGADEKIVVDVLVTSSKVTVFKSRFIQCHNSHGTGCTLSSAIASNLSKGKDLETAVTLAIDYIHGCMSSDLDRLDHSVDPATSVVEVEEKERDGENLKERNLKERNLKERNLKEREIVSERKNLKEENVSESKNLTQSNLKDSEIKDSLKNTKIIEQTLKNADIEAPLVFFLKNNSNWKAYTQHPILSLIATDALPKKQFMYFLNQDYHYLQTYARVHGYAISVATTCEQIELHTQALRSILDELARHQTKFSGALSQPGRACVQYCDYLTHIAKTENIVGINVALAPCLHGYAEAGVYGLAKRTEYLKESGSQGDKMYTDWLADYSSDWYIKAHLQGMQALQKMLEEEELSETRKARYCEIFAKVTDLEIGFWDEVLEQ